jgi:hypothetical protein
MANEKQKSSGDWQKDKTMGYAAHVNPERGVLEGPEDAFIFFGLPYEGNPMRNTRFDQWQGKEVPVEPYIDKTKLSAELCGVPVKWVAWDEETGCNVYQREGAL